MRRIRGEVLKKALSLFAIPCVEVGGESSVGPVQIDKRLYKIKIQVEEYEPECLKKDKEGSL